MAKELWIAAECRDTGIDPAVYELLSKAIELNDTIAEKKTIAIITMNADDASLNALKHSGADKVIAVKMPDTVYDPVRETAALAGIVRKYAPEIILFAATAKGAELAPSLAAKLKTGLASHCTDLSYDEGGNLHMYSPAFGGKLIGESSNTSAG